MADFTSGAPSLATDAAWNAAGDIVYATADDTAAILTVGSTNAVLQVTCGLPAWNTCVTLAGNLTVQGTTTTIESTVTTIVDPLVIYSQGTTGTPTKDSGFVVERGCSANVAFLWDESADEFAVVGCTSETGTTAGNVTITAYGNLHAADVIVGSNVELGHACDTTLARASSGDVNIQGNIIYRAGGTDVPVADGGTGLSCLTTGSVLIGTGTSDVTLVAMTTKGHLLGGDGSGAPRALAVGSNCQVLTACSSETTGMKWACASGGGGLDSCADAIISNGYGIVLGNCAQLAGGDNPSNVVAEFQMVGTGDADTAIHIIRHSANAATASLKFAKSRNGTIGSHTVVAACDVVGAIQFYGCDGDDFQPRIGEILAKVDGTPGSGDMPGRLEFHTTRDGAEDPTLAMKIDKCGDATFYQQVLVDCNCANASAPAMAFRGEPDTGFFKISHDTIGIAAGGSEHIRLDLAGGGKRIGLNDNDPGGGTVILRVCQGAYDDHIMSFGSSDVAHGVTAVAATDTFAVFKKNTGAVGGLRLETFSNASIGFRISTIVNTTVTSDTTGSSANMILYPLKRCGTDVMVTCGQDNVFAITDGSATRFLWKAGGEFHLDCTTLNAMDAHCDVGLLRTLETTLRTEGVIKSKWDDFVSANVCSLIDAGLYSVPPSEGGLLNVNQLLKLHNGAVWQLWTNIKDQSEELATLKGQVNALTGGCP